MYSKVHAGSMPIGGCDAMMYGIACSLRPAPRSKRFNQRYEERGKTVAYDTNNIFAKILRGEAPCVRVYEDDKTLVFMDLMPQADGHLLVIPKEPAVNLIDLSEEAAEACIRTTKRMVIAVRKALNVDGVHVAQLNGAAAGQSVPHCHFHVIPHNTGTVWRPHAAVMADQADLQAMAERIKAAL